MFQTMCLLERAIYDTLIIMYDFLYHIVCLINAYTIFPLYYKYIG